MKKVCLGIGISNALFREIRSDSVVNFAPIADQSEALSIILASNPANYRARIARNHHFAAHL
jgi:hypothetical protein